jgi:hypothetical protein
VKTNVAWRRPAFGGAVVAALCLSGPGAAQHGRPVAHPVPRPAPAYHGFEHHGSVHFAPREFHPDVHPHYGDLHYYEHRDRDHDWARPWWGVPYYRPEYFRRFRPGWATLAIGGGTYYYYPALPGGCGTVVVNDQLYYLCDGIYYVPYFYGGTTVYVAVPPPQ